MKSATVDGSPRSPTGGVEESCPTPHNHEQMTTSNYGYDTAYTFTHSNIMFEPNVMNNMDTVAHMNVHNTQYWAHCSPSVDAQCFQIALVVQVRLVRVIPSMHAHLCVVSYLSSSLCSLFSTSSHRSPSPQCSTRGPGPTPCVVPAWRAWSHPTTSPLSKVNGPKQDLNLTNAEELDFVTTSDIHFQHTLDDTASFPNDPEVDDNQLAEFLAVVVDRTGKLVEVRSNNDQFSCDIRNLKSAQSQFPFVTQLEMICQTGGSVQARIAEERESSQAQIRTMLDEQRRTIIAECSEKVLHHELLAAHAEQNR